MRRLGHAALLAALALPACASYPLGDPTTALARTQSLAAQGETEGVAVLGGRLADSSEAESADRAEAAWLSAEADMALGNHGRAFARYRWVLENAPWSEHAAEIEDRLFTIGQVVLFDPSYDSWWKDRGRGVAALETLQLHFRNSERGDDALKLVGDYFASIEEYGEASRSYLRMTEEYPGSEWAERCLWLAGHCRLLMAGGPLYDRNDLLRARELIERSLATHPRGVAVREAQQDLATVTELLAEAELLVADFYRAREVPRGEHLRLANAALLYPDTVAGGLARQRLLAAGIDVEMLRAGSSHHSIDTIRATRPLWEQEREGRVPQPGLGGFFR